MKLEELIELFLKKGTGIIFIGQKHIQRTAEQLPDSNFPSSLFMRGK